MVSASRQRRSATVYCRTGRAGLVNGPALLEHGDELLEPALPGLLPFRVVQAVEHGVAVPPVQLLERAPGTRAFRQPRLEIGRYRHRTRRGVGRLPTAVPLRRLHL